MTTSSILVFPSFFSGKDEGDQPFHLFPQLLPFRPHQPDILTFWNTGIMTYHGFITDVLSAGVHRGGRWVSHGLTSHLLQQTVGLQPPAAWTSCFSVALYLSVCIFFFFFLNHFPFYCFLLKQWQIRWKLQASHIISEVTWEYYGRDIQPMGLKKQKQDKSGTEKNK